MAPPTAYGSACHVPSASKVFATRCVSSLQPGSGGPFGMEFIWNSGYGCRSKPLEPWWMSIPRRPRKYAININIKFIINQDNLCNANQCGFMFFSLAGFHVSTHSTRHSFRDASPRSLRSWISWWRLSLLAEEQPDPARSV